MNARNLVCACLLAAAAAGCGYGGDDPPPSDWTCGEPRSSTIDSGAELDIAAGEGVGVFFEYLGQGEWRVSTSCDTSSSGYDCSWDVVVWPLEGDIADFSSTGLEAGDAIERQLDGSLRLIASTATDLDGTVFAATPGAPLRFDALLDGACANAYMYWIGDGAVHTGSPSNPLDLTPTEE